MHTPLLQEQTPHTPEAQASAPSFLSQAGSSIATFSRQAVGKAQLALGGLALAATSDAAPEAHVPRVAHVRPSMDKLLDTKGTEQSKAAQQGVDKATFFGALQDRGIDPSSQKIPFAELQTVVVDLLKHPNFTVRRAAISEAGNQGFSDAIPHLAGMFSSNDHAEATLAGKALNRLSLKDPSAFAVFTKALDDPRTLDRALDALVRSPRAVGGLATTINKKLSDLYDANDENSHRKLKVAFAHLQVGTADQDRMMKHVLEAHQDNDGQKYRPASNFLKTKMSRNPCGEMAKVLFASHLEARANKDGWQVVHTACGLANAQCVQHLPSIVQTLNELRGPEAVNLAQAIYKSFDLIEMGREALMKTATNHPDLEVRFILTKGIGETFRGPHIAQWAAQNLQVINVLRQLVRPPQVQGVAEGGIDD